MVAFLGGSAWVMGTLLPEYCLTILADSELSNGGPMGRLIAFITALPFLFVGPMVAVYGLQYLGRVLVEGGEGESRPPRLPDRNFEGVVDGLMAWLIWLVFGVAVGALPLVVYGLAGSMGLPWNLGVAAVLGLIGFPYALMALVMTFLVDGAAAAWPGRVLDHLRRLGPSFLKLALTTAAIGGCCVGAFALALVLRPRVFALYVLASLVCWLMLAWSTIVAMQTLGAYFHQHRRRFRD